jgi:lysophospholipase L1-like esterase
MCVRTLAIAVQPEARTIGRRMASASSQARFPFDRRNQEMPRMPLIDLRTFWNLRTFWLGLMVVALVALVSAPALAQDAQTDAQPPTIHIAGDSTAAATGRESNAGWGRYLQTFFDSGKVRVNNRALGGRSSRTFITEGHWEKLRSTIRPGDVVLIQFGHNDRGAINDPSRARGSLPGLGEETEEIDNLKTKQREVVRTYGWYMRKMIAEARAQGATPVVLSLTVRNIWDAAGRVERGSGRYGAWAREIAKAENAAFIDLTNLIADEYERMGKTAVAALFPLDHTHTGEAGALLNARLVVQGLKGLGEEKWDTWYSPEGRSALRAPTTYVALP